MKTGNDYRKRIFGYFLYRKMSGLG